MTVEVALLTIHGMGDTKKAYFGKLEEILEKKLGHDWGRVFFRPIYYQDILQANQEEIFRKTRPHVDWTKLRKFLLYGFSDAASLEYKKSEENSSYFRVQKKSVMNWIALLKKPESEKSRSFFCTLTRMPSNLELYLGR